MRCAGLLLLVSLASCVGSGDSRLGIPPCNAWIFLAGAADLKLDCPARATVPVLKEAVEQAPAKPTAKPAKR